MADQPACTECAVPVYRRTNERGPGKKKAGARGMCSTCYQRWQRVAVVEPVSPAGPQLCSRCGVQSKDGGLCRDCRDVLEDLAELTTWAVA